MGKIKVTPCDIKGLYVIEPTVFKDERGYFMETYNQNDFHDWGVTYLVGISDYRICSMFVRLRIFKENPKKQSGIFAVRLA